MDRSRASWRPENSRWPGSAAHFSLSHSELGIASPTNRSVGPLRPVLVALSAECVRSAVLWAPARLPLATYVTATRLYLKFMNGARAVYHSRRKYRFCLAAVSRARTIILIARGRSCRDRFPPGRFGLPGGRAVSRGRGIRDPRSRTVFKCLIVVLAKLLKRRISCALVKAKVSRAYFKAVMRWGNKDPRRAA